MEDVTDFDSKYENDIIISKLRESLVNASGGGVTHGIEVAIRKRKKEIREKVRNE